MYLLPAVKTIKELTGSFKLNENCIINISSDILNASYITNFLFSQINIYIGLQLDVIYEGTPADCIILKSDRKDNNNESYILSVTENNVEIHGASDCALFRGVTTFIQMVKFHGSAIPCCWISDCPDFRIRGFLHDTTRGKVPTLDTLKEIALQCSFYKINHLQLYIEHSYAFSMIPEFVVESDPLTSDEIRELDEFCKKHFIELVPALATFGHLYELLRIKRFSHLNELDIDASKLHHNLWDRMAHYTMNPESEEGYKLVRSMIEEILPLFSSSYFNICADETFDLGIGKSKDLVKKIGTGQVYAGFVNKILDIVIENGKIPMMWGDIILNHPEILPSFPEKTIFLNWGYGADVNSESTEKFANEKVQFCVCPGVMGWSRFANNIDDASVNIQNMVAFGKKYGALGVLNTNWGDCGNVNFFSGSLHGLALGAALSWNSGIKIDSNGFDTLFSIVQWGTGYENIGSLLRKLGSCTWYHLGNIYSWIRDLSCLWNRECDVEKIEMEGLISSLDTARSIKCEFEKLYRSNTNGLVHNDLDVFIWSSSAISWTCELMIFKKNHQFGQESATIVKKNYLINHTFELIVEFKRLWRRKNKESELKNVVEIFSDVIKKIERMQ